MILKMQTEDENDEIGEMRNAKENFEKPEQGQNRRNLNKIFKLN